MLEELFKDDKCAREVELIEEEIVVLVDEVFSRKRNKFLDGGGGAIFLFLEVLKVDEDNMLDNLGKVRLLSELVRLQYIDIIKSEYIFEDKKGSFDGTKT